MLLCYNASLCRLPTHVYALLLTLATPPMATHTKYVGEDTTNAYMDIRQRIDALLKGGSCKEDFCKGSFARTSFTLF
jgi:hypothetical protein